MAKYIVDGLEYTETKHAWLNTRITEQRNFVTWYKWWCCFCNGIEWHTWPNEPREELVIPGAVMPNDARPDNA